ncbi:shikimate dehydrogenase [uncultured Serinicoccus sp.]|uniref:shikimate dehydrogenase n=1 Tax=uncultured Serinicoccus sp. TaxID=735514 RepID=UPI0026145054|nr:shikimate dehydrogenase [uncultured Serinicoccus sp.]
MLTRAGVVGSPVAHSLSPVLHHAAYAALGLGDWSYDRTEVPAGGLGRFVESLGPEWVGLSVTMPGKEEALALAQAAGGSATAVGAANTLVRRPEGWYADNTDVDGLRAALLEAGLEDARRAVVLGGGATARSAFVALQGLGVRVVEVLVRDRLRPQTAQLLESLGLDTHVRRLADGIPLDAAEVVLSTLPGGTPAPPVRDGGAHRPVAMDVGYAPWPSPFADAVAEATQGRVRVVRGTRMLLHQAARQVELMTGREAPTPAMDLALRRALEGRAPR